MTLPLQSSRTQARQSSAAHACVDADPFLKLPSAVVSNPQFLREGAAIRGLKHPHHPLYRRRQTRAKEVIWRRSIVHSVSTTPQTSPSSIQLRRITLQRVRKKFRHAQLEAPRRSGQPAAFCKTRHYAAADPSQVKDVWSLFPTADRASYWLMLYFCPRQTSQLARCSHRLL